MSAFEAGIQYIRKEDAGDRTAGNCRAAAATDQKRLGASTDDGRLTELRDCGVT